MPKSKTAYKLAQAKAKLGQLCDETMRGCRPRIIRKGELFELVHVKRLEIVSPSEMELRACYADSDEISLINRFGEESL